ncbi:hypothetical protein Btru_010430 [Bulinus truncatus]|nr:hypothetical protein Btru_010430 [Bulinus truncatus]
MRLKLLLVTSFVLLYISTNYANKYVLSVLKFTYPTIFQGWQSLVGVIMFRCLYSAGYIDSLLHSREWHDCALWLPGMMSFLLSIYSGSRALANLPIPVYLVMQNIVLVFRATADLLFRKQMTSLYSYFMLMMSISSALIAVKIDPQYDPDGYFWMSVHIVSLGCLEMYTNFIQSKLKFRGTEKLFSCYLYSFIVLAPSSYFIGDTMQAINFHYFHSSHFYVGCILSGLLGVLLNLCSLYLQELKTPSMILDAWTIQSVAKILCSVVSLVFFDMSLTQAFFICLSINLLSSFGYIESSTSRRQQTSLIYASDITMETEMYSQDKKQYLKRHELQQDMIRLDLGS